MDSGSLKDEGRIAYRSDRLKPAFLSLGTGRDPVRARACFDCGYLELSIDPADLRKRRDNAR